MTRYFIVLVSPESFHVPNTKEGRFYVDNSEDVTPSELSEYFYTLVTEKFRPRSSSVTLPYFELTEEQFSEWVV